MAKNPERQKCWRDWCGMLWINGVLTDAEKRRVLKRIEKSGGNPVAWKRRKSEGKP